MNELPRAEQAMLARAERRVGWVLVGLVLAGATLALWRWGAAMAAAVAVGGALAYVNYRWVVAVVDTLVRAQQARPSRRTYVKLLAPLVLLVGVLYVIFTRRWLSGFGILSGLLALPAAVLLELIYELILGVRQ